MKKIDFDLENFLEDVASFTENNQHTERLLYIADQLDYDYYRKIFMDILHLHCTIGYLPSHLVQFRYDMEQELYKAIEKQYGHVVMAQIKMS